MTVESTSRFVLYWILIPSLNFSLWFMMGRIEHPNGYFDNEICPTPLPIILEAPPCPVDTSLKSKSKSARASHAQSSYARLPVHSCGSLLMKPNPSLKSVPAKDFSKYRNEDLVEMHYPGWTTIVNPYDEYGAQCESFVNPSLGKLKDCLAVAVAGTRAAHQLLRFDQAEKWKGLVSKRKEFFPTGFFRRVGNKKGRARIAEKMGPLFVQLADVEALVRAKMKRNGVREGDDVVVMVSNAGEMDLFMNFACSCRFHNISMNHMIVFAGSSDVVPLVEATGAMAVYHTSFAAVARAASVGYLDSVFVDMMWYKAFSVWLMLRQGVNVLFQDVDLVWFRDPFPWFREYVAAAKNESATGAHPDAFFSDDGQRSLRYTPFYANSGFYYLINNPRTRHFAWSVMVAFDLLQTTGSHQNVFTMKLNEQIDMAGIHPKLLSIKDFPTGIMRHHNPKFMDGIKEGRVKPFHFHMCWTAGKSDKLVYFKEAAMWYVRDATCSLDALHPHQGTVGRKVDRLEMEQVPLEDRWKQVSKLCCQRMKHAP